MSLYLTPLLTAFALSLVVSGVVAFLVAQKKLSARFGGTALICAFLATLFVSQDLHRSDAIWGLIIGSVLILIVGLVDDVKPLSWRTQLFCQIGIVLAVFAIGVRVEAVTNPFGGIVELPLVAALVFSVVWFVLIMNAVNWIDGVDGLSGGVLLIAGLTVFLLALLPEVNQPPVGVITAALIGAIAGFLLFNVHPAKIIAGTSGSFFMGFALAVLGIFAGAKIATTLLVLAIPLTDALWVVWERFRSGSSIFSGDRRHLHHKLRDLGYSVPTITALYYGVTIAIAFVALNTRQIGKLYTIIAVFALLLTFVWFVARRHKTKIA